MRSEHSLHNLFFASRHSTTPCRWTDNNLPLLRTLLTNFCPLFLVTFTLTAVDPAYAQAELSPAQLDAALSATYLDGPSGMPSLDEAAALRAQEASAANIGLGALYGLLLAMMFFNLFQFIRLRDRVYLLYVLAIGAQTVLLFLNAHHLSFLLGDFTTSLWLLDTAERLIYPAAAVSFIAFQRSLLNIPQNNSFLDNVGRWLITAFCVAALLSLIPDKTYYQFSLITLLVIGLPVVLCSNLDSMRNGNRSLALLHSAATSACIIGITAHLLVEAVPGFPVNIFSASAYNLGLITQALLLSLSLSTRYALINQEKEDAQRLAIDNLVRAESIKDDLLANVSHELRTPLFGINGLAGNALEAFRRNNQNAGLIIKNLELIQASGDRLMTLVNDLLDFSSRGPDGNQLKLESVDLHRMATLIIAICSPKIGEKPIKLRNTVDPELPLIEADKDRLQRILVNLTANAIEFTRSGEVDIGGEVIADSMIRIRVLDTGIGIHESEHEKIFRNVEKLPSRKQNAQGVGLGLPIAKHMIEMHLSKLSMTSALGVGSEFSFNLRMALDQSRASVASTFDEQMIMRAEFAQEALRREADPALRSQQNITVMIVDDDEINRIVIGQQLSEYTVINYTNGMDALTAVSESKPDLILLDLMMPGLSGHEVCQKIRQRYNPIELPIILVTAKNHLENLAEALATGANDFLPKPFHKQELKSRVENQLKLSLMHRTSKENMRLRSLIKSYSEADRELRHSRMQLQQVLETIDEGFIAFELPGQIFSFNKTATDLLGTDRETLEGAEIASVFKKSLNSEKLLDALARWETEDLQSNSGDLVFSLQEKIQLAIPYGDANKLNAEMVTADVRLMLFGNNEGTGVLFILTDKENSEEGCRSKKRYDAAELVGILGQVQQNMRRINARLSVLKPIELNQQPDLLEELIRIDSLVAKITSNLPDMDSDSEYRQQLVTLMRSALHAWEVTTQKSKIELAEESNIWAVSIDDGRLRTRTFDRYLRLEQLPKVPRWREVVRTAYFVLSIPTIETETRLGLEHELEKTKALLKKAAID